jgi:hypothetical protein
VATREVAQPGTGGGSDGTRTIRTAHSARSKTKGFIMNTRTLTDEPAKPEEPPDQPKTRTALRGTELLVSGYLGISVCTLVAIVLLRNHTAQ